MARTSDILVAFMAAHGNRALAGIPIPYTRLRGIYQSDEHCTSCPRFWEGSAEPGLVALGPQPQLAFEAWAARGGVERLGIVHPTRLFQSPPRLHGTQELARSVTAELNGG